MAEWTPTSWKNFPALQQPVYQNRHALHEVEQELEKWPPLVFAGESNDLKKKLNAVSQGNAFLLQGGDCAESFSEFSAVNIRDTFKVLMQMAVILSFGASKSVIKVGRIGGQFAKPRSNDTETQGNITLPCYRGDIINASEFTEAARQPDPGRILRAYHQASSTLNLVRAFAHGGLASLEKVHAWNLNFVKGQAVEKYYQLAERIGEAMQFMKACGITVDSTVKLRTTDFYTSHEALLLPYESVLTRRDHISGKWYACSGHMLWLGDRTRQLNGAHVEFLRGIQNPIGIKAGPTITPQDLMHLLDTLNPQNEGGRITLITRMGTDKIKTCLPPLIRRVQQEGRRVVWSCDPMHGNTIQSHSGYKTRKLAAILSEVKDFFEIHKAENSYAGGIHIEMTGTDVTECIGGNIDTVTEQSLAMRYNTHCDPRLNAGQSLEVAFMVSEILNTFRSS